LAGRNIFYFLSSNILSIISFLENALFREIIIIINAHLMAYQKDIEAINHIFANFMVKNISLNKFGIPSQPLQRRSRK
jgi:hypothetical protein